MGEAITIPKDKSSFPEYLDFFKLREIGLEHIQKLGSDIWTDYNLHDPGITILEVLCYAVTDLGYRANFDIKDLIARSKADKNNSRETLLNQPYDDNFYSAASILGCNPVTVTDFRRLFIDIPGVRNAWIEKSCGQEIRIGINKENKELYYIDGNNEKSNEGRNNSSNEDHKDSIVELKINGLYDICIEIEPQLTTDACGRTVVSREDIIKKVYEVFHLHRNLCEDVRDVMIYGEEEIALCSDIELTADADPEEVMLQICLRIEEFLSPPLHFYTLQEMAGRGKTIEEIFEGRPMTVPDIQSESESNYEPDDLSFIPGHGFIDIDELKKMEPRSRINVSDIYNKIMEVEGVQAIHKLVLVNYVNDLPQTKGEKWCLPLTKGYMPHMGIESSKVNFLKGPLYFSYDKNEVIQRFTEEKYAKSKTLLEPYQLDLPIPDGTFRDLKDYTSIQHEFPLTYGIGHEGLADPSTPLRKAQAHQLKAYLLFYDQILANYLSQLGHIRDLFAMRPDHDETRKDLNHTYFTQILQDVPGAEELIKNCNECCNAGCSKERLPEDYPSYLACIAEYPEDYQKRRNRFLDHLLARFSESFTDYVMLLYKIQKGNRNEQNIINCKASFLENYPDISRNRGKAFNILERPEWDTENVAGLKKRITAQLGIESSSRHTLSRGEIVQEAGGWFYIVEIDVNNNKVPVLKSSKIFESDTSARSAFKDILPQLEDQDRYYILSYTIPELKGYSYTIVDESGIAIVRSLEHFTSIDKLKEHVNEVIDLFEGEEYTFNYPEEPVNFYYEVINKQGLAILKSDNIYVTRQNAEESQSILRVMAKYSMNYCRQDSLLEDAVQYGFVFMQKSDNQLSPEIIAQSARRFETIEECEEFLYSFISMAKLKNISCQVNQEVDCFEYWLYDVENKNAIFKSNSDYYDFKTASEASETFIREFMSFAVNEDNYEDIEKDHTYGFTLYSDTNHEIPIAIHPFYYDTIQERKDRKWAIIYYLDEQPIEPPLIGGTPGEFNVEIKDQSGQIQLISPAIGTGLIFKTETHARRTCQKIRRRASDWSQQYYVVLNDLEGDKPFSFQIQDRDNSILAEHPQRYATELERDLAIKILMYGIRNQMASYRHMKEEEGYRFELLDMNHEVIMRSVAVYPDIASSESCWKEVLSRACARSNYQLTEIKGNTFPYSFRLLGKSNEFITVHTRSYATEKERDLALQSVINYICYTEFNENIRGNSGTYTYALKGKCGRVLLECADRFSDEPAAISAFREMINLAKDYANYNKDLHGYRFEILNEEQHPVARPPAGYKFISEKEREAAIAMIMCYLRDDKINYTIENVGGSFYTEISDNLNQILLQGTTLSPSCEKAHLELNKLTGFAADPQNYMLDENEKRLCPYSFSIQDNNGKRVARHPSSYNTMEDLHKAQLNVLSWLSDWKKLKDSIITLSDTEGAKYCYELKDFSGKILLTTRDLTKFNSREEAADENTYSKYLLAALNPSNYTLLLQYNKDTNKCNYSYHITDPHSKSNAILFKHPHGYDDQKTRDDKINSIIHFLTPRQYKTCIKGTACGFSYNMEFNMPLRHNIEGSYDDYSSKKINPGRQKKGSDTPANILVSIEGIIRYPTRGKAWKAACMSVELMKSENHYFIPNEDEEAIWLIKDRQGLTVARLFANGEPEEIREYLIHQLLYSEPLIQSDIQPQDPALYYRLKETDNVLLKSASEIKYNSVALWGGPAFHSQKEAHESVDKLARFIQNTDPASSIFETMVTDTGYQLKLKMDSVVCILAKNGIFNAEGIKEWKETALLFGKSKKNYELTELPESHDFSFSIVDGSLKEEPDKTACDVSNEISELAQHEKYYRYIRCTEACLHGFELLGKTGSVIASHNRLYVDVAKNQKIIATIKSLLNNEGMHIVEHILLRPRTESLYISSVRSKQELEGESFLPVPDFCYDTSEDSCTELSDPYSFRLTIVIPFWPARFNDPEFREFMENTLRRETPSHIFPRICWLDTCQMTTFEKAYRRWLKTLNIDNIHCDAVASRNSLIEVLEKLRSKYPEAKLHDCGQRTLDKNIVILDYTRLG